MKLYNKKSTISLLLYNISTKIYATPENSTPVIEASPLDRLFVRRQVAGKAADDWGFSQDNPFTNLPVSLAHRL